MTLVLCRIQGDRFFIFADTRLTMGNTRLPVTQGVIKTCFLSPDISVSFAQSPESATRDIQKFSEESNGLSYGEVVRFFEESSLRTSNDYLIAFSRTKLIVKIRDGVGKKVLGSTAWIGDQNAYQRFREYEHGRIRGQKDKFWDAIFFATHPDAPMDSARFSRALGFYEATLVDPEILSAGDFFTVTTNVGNDLKLMAISRLFFDVPSRLLDTQGRQIMSATGENIEYRFSSLAPKTAGTNAAGFYYPNAQLGYVFYSDAKIGVADKCQLHRNCSIDQFIALCKKETGVEFDYLETSHTQPTAS